MLFWISATLFGYICAQQVDMLPVLDFSETWLDGTSTNCACFHEAAGLIDANRWCRYMQIDSDS